MAEETTSQLSVDNVESMSSVDLNDSEADTDNHSNNAEYTNAVNCQIEVSNYYDVWLIEFKWPKHVQKLLEEDEKMTSDDVYYCRIIPRAGYRKHFFGHLGPRRELERILGHQKMIPIDAGLQFRHFATNYQTIIAWNTIKRIRISYEDRVARIYINQDSFEELLTPDDVELDPWNLSKASKVIMHLDTADQLRNLVEYCQKHDVLCDHRQKSFRERVFGLFHRIARSFKADDGKDLDAIFYINQELISSPPTDRCIFEEPPRVPKCSSAKLEVAPVEIVDADVVPTIQNISIVGEYLADQLSNIPPKPERNVKDLPHDDEEEEEEIDQEDEPEDVKVELEVYEQGEQIEAEQLEDEQEGEQVEGEQEGEQVEDEQEEELEDESEQVEQEEATDDDKDQTKTLEESVDEGELLEMKKIHSKDATKFYPDSGISFNCEVDFDLE